MILPEYCKRCGGYLGCGGNKAHEHVCGEEKNRADAVLTDELIRKLQKHAAEGPLDLSFEALRVANIARNDETPGREKEWSLAEWTNALAGEAGEACNIAKKVSRELPGDPTLDDVKEELGFELADIVTYADLIAMKLGISLGDFVRRKFNIVSERRDSDVKL